MLYPRPENRPMTRARTPASFSTSTEIVALRCGCSTAGIGLDQNQAFVGDPSRLGFVLRPQDHLVMRRPRWDHRETVLRRVDADIGDHRLLGRDHLADH